MNLVCSTYQRSLSVCVKLTYPYDPLMLLDERTNLDYKETAVLQVDDVRDPTSEW